MADKTEQSNKLNPPKFDINDKNVVKLARDGDNEALEFIFDYFRNYLKVISNRFCLIGAEKEDIIQEGMMGLFRAINDYKFDNDISFKTFGSICIQRQVKSALRTNIRQKHMALNSSVSLQSVKSDEDTREFANFVAGDGNAFNPEEIVISNENSDTIYSMLSDSLSRFEKDILALYNQGLSYKEISEIKKKSIKSIDNAVQRIRRKTEIIVKNYL